MAAFMHEPSVSSLAIQASAAFDGPARSRIALGDGAGQSVSAEDLHVDDPCEIKPPKFQMSGAGDTTSVEKPHDG